MKIVNLSKFVRSILIALGIIVFISLFVSNKSFSHADTKYKTIYILSGDTLWSIAKEEKETNSYYENNDIRDIVSNIKNINNLNGSDLSVNQKLIIPYI